MARKWSKFPYPDKAIERDDAAVKKAWARLHRGDAEAAAEGCRGARGVDRVPRRATSPTRSTRARRRAARASTPR